jgi:TonB family protein
MERSSPAAAGTTPGADARPDTQAGGDSIPITDWDMTSPGKDRPPIFVVRPEIPGWVNARGGVLTVIVSFMVSRNGIVSGARVASSCGFPDVDSAVVDAVMMWHFSSDPSAGTVTSTIRYVVKGRGAR